MPIIHVFSIAVFALLVFSAGPAYAYIGPAIAAVGYLLGPIGAVIAAIAMILYLPTRKLWKKTKAKKADENKAEEE